jgi:hypothetical protein
MTLGFKLRALHLLDRCSTTWALCHPSKHQFYTCKSVYFLVFLLEFFSFWWTRRGKRDPLWWFFQVSGKGFSKLRMGHLAGWVTTSFQAWWLGRAGGEPQVCWKALSCMLFLIGTEGQGTSAVERARPPVPENLTWSACESWKLLGSSLIYSWYEKSFLSWSTFAYWCWESNSGPQSYIPGLSYPEDRKYSALLGTVLSILRDKSVICVSQFYIKSFSSCKTSHEKFS